ncbi:MAG: hypothetical protein OSA99_05790 [Acidimicrobiales bacterium]|nr:hypothetical protein [Acidimicrobiales bacterium]
MNKTKFVGALLAGGMLFAACGDDGGGSSAESNEYSDAVAASIRSEGDVPFSDDEVDCLSRELVDAIGGPSAFEDAGLSPEDLEGSSDLADIGLDVSEEQADAVAASFGKCDINLTDAFLSDLGDEVPDDVKSCVEDSFDEDAFADLFAQTLVSGDPGNDLPPELLEDLMACIG